MSKFGWDLPPGCSISDISGNRPGDDICEICFQSVPDDCVCPECPTCGEVGNPDCYIDHGLKRTLEQKMCKLEEERTQKIELRGYWEQERRQLEEEKVMLAENEEKRR